MLVFFTCVLSLSALSLTGCGADVDLILQNDTVQEETAGDPDSPAQEEMQGTHGADVICVYICGAVCHPGVYEMQDAGRIYELVELAGGLTQDADACSVNLARTVSDGEMIRIPTVDETAGTAGGSVSVPGISGTDSGKVNINTADIAQLTALNGIGEVKAAAIVAYREAHGSFQRVEEIMEVSGIGEGTFDKIKEEITI